MTAADLRDEACSQQPSRSSTEAEQRAWTLCCHQNAFWVTKKKKKNLLHTSKPAGLFYKHSLTKSSRKSSFPRTRSRNGVSGKTSPELRLPSLGVSLMSTAKKSWKVAPHPALVASVLGDGDVCAKALHPEDDGTGRIQLKTVQRGSWTQIWAYERGDALEPKAIFIQSWEVTLQLRLQWNH